MSALFTDRRVIYVPAADKDKANAALEAVGFGPSNFSIPLAVESDQDSKVVAYGTDWQMRPDQWVTIQNALTKVGVTFNATLLNDVGHARICIHEVSASSARKVVYSDKAEIITRK